VTTTTSIASMSGELPKALKKKRVLLVDTSSTKRDLRAEVMRRLGIDVDCAADITEARSCWVADLYDLVLIGMDNGSGHRDSFCEYLRSATPVQRLAFLVGKPQYLADSPSAEREFLAEESGEEGSPAVAIAELANDVRELPQRWGILEASRRISEVRSAAVARIRAMRDLPAPPRDSEGRRPKRTTVASTLDDLLRKEMQ
jgi:CheY-like chemotaxis protein